MHPRALIWRLRIPVSRHSFHHFRAFLQYSPDDSARSKALNAPPDLLIYNDTKSSRHFPPVIMQSQTHNNEIKFILGSMDVAEQTAQSSHSINFISPPASDYSNRSSADADGFIVLSLVQDFSRRIVSVRIELDRIAILGELLKRNPSSLILFPCIVALRVIAWQFSQFRLHGMFLLACQLFSPLFVL